MLYILSLSVKGYKSQEIGDFMAISPRTVEKNKANIMQKMKVSNIAQLLNLEHNLKLFCDEISLHAR